MQEPCAYLPNSLQQLVNGCIQKDRAAQAQLYKLYCNKMMSLCMWYAKNKQEAEEILQDGFVCVFVYIQTYNGDGTLESWIRKIMVNAALLKFRKKKNSHLRLVVPYDAGLHDKAGSCSVTSKYDEKELLKLIQSLPPSYRMVFSLYVLEGLKHKEIAARLGISVSTSKSNLADARTILQRKITGQKQTVF